MIQSVRRRRKKRKDLLGIIGIISIFAIGGVSFYFLNSINDPLDNYGCSIKNGPNAVTTIIFDKSETYTNDQVTDIKSSFNSWLSGNEPATKDRPINLEQFAVGNLIQLFVTDQDSLNLAEGLTPVAQLCVPKDFKDANIYFENPSFLERRQNQFISKFNNAIDSLLEEAEGKSPILETLIRISNSESFQMYSDKPRNMLIVSDMLQNSDKYSHYRTNQGPSWEVFEEKMSDTIYVNVRFNKLKVQVFYATRQSERDRKLQQRPLVEFWKNFFKNSNAEMGEWIRMDG